MRTIGPVAIYALLPPVGQECGEPGADAADRRAVPRHAVLREPADERLAQRQSQARAAADATDRHRSHLSQTANELAGGRAQDFPVFTAECGGPSAQLGVGDGHHLRAAASRVLVTRGDHGLV